MVSPPKSVHLDKYNATPDWVDRMNTKVWYRLSGDQPDLNLPSTPKGTRYLDDNDPALDPILNPPKRMKERVRRLLGRRPLSPWNGTSGFPAITDSWNSAILATRVGPSGSMIVFGGGHNDYFGSDVHRFDLASREWSRISDGYVAGKQSDYGAGAVYPEATYPDGSPLPPHTYDYLQYDVVSNDLILFKGQIQLGAEVQAVAIPHMFNLDTLRWRRGPRHETAVFNSGGWTTWDARRRVLWGHSGDDGGGNGLSWFSPDGANGNGTFGNWGPLYPSKLPGTANHNSMQIDPGRNLILVTAHEPNALFAMNPATPMNPLFRLSEGGEKPRLSPYAALEFSSRLDCFVYYSASDSRCLYAIKVPGSSSVAGLMEGTWCWERLPTTIDSVDPIADAATVTANGSNASHVFGRLRFADYRDATVAILVRHVDTAVYAIKLEDGGTDQR